ncbi:MAG TPA: polysaccharide deacetylase family protein [Longimicrobiaceae bacterium]|nr:polysaccharide deacetylase family protein [Longimicrobiaceae bacterium]
MPLYRVVHRLRFVYPRIATEAVLRAVGARRALVVMYHRVVDAPSDTFGVNITPTHFAEQLEVLRRSGRPIHLTELARTLAGGRVPDRAIVVTIDDGYADSFETAKPILERYGIPATVFVTTGHVGGPELWWGRLERMLLQPGVLPDTLSLLIRGRTQTWHLNGAANLGEEEHRRHRQWAVTHENPPSDRHRLFHQLYTLLYRLTPAERADVLGQLHAWSDVCPEPRPEHRGLSPDELVALADTPLVEIGAHSVTHPALDRVPASVQRDEIFGARAFLEEILDRRVESFAYPHGRYTAETRKLVKEAGFSCACTAQPGSVWRRTDPLRIPRTYAPDEDGDSFARRLRRWL